MTPLYLHSVSVSAVSLPSVQPARHSSLSAQHGGPLYVCWPSEAYFCWFFWGSVGFPEKTSLSESSWSWAADREQSSSNSRKHIIFIFKVSVYAVLLLTPVLNSVLFLSIIVRNLQLYSSVYVIDQRMEHYTHLNIFVFHENKRVHMCRACQSCGLPDWNTAVVWVDKRRQHTMEWSWPTNLFGVFQL